MNKFLRIVSLLFLTISNLLASTNAEATTVDFETDLSKYVAAAKDVSKRRMNPEDETKLSDMVLSILSNLKKLYVNEKLQSEDFVLKYLDGKDFPDLERHKNENKNDETVVRFTIAIHAFYKSLTKERIIEIIKKSPLEMAPILREINVFLQFVSANPSDYGHGRFSEKSGNITIVFATNEAILRIMRPIIYKNLLSKTIDVYKLSRIVSAFYNGIPNRQSEEIFKTTTESMKRNTADDSRIAIAISENEVR
ncbi:MAG: hypothetical protein LBM19_00140 [Holosporales bacterium]|nr:hypothetical protein [Holosporales bacterium]